MREWGVGGRPVLGREGADPAPVPENQGGL